MDTNIFREINLAAFPGPNKLTTGGMVLSEVAGGDKIKVWADTSKTTEVAHDKARSVAWSIASFPDTLYVEGIKPSDTVRDIQLRLCYTNKTFSCRDEIRLTSVKVELITPAGDPVNMPVDGGDGDNEVRCRKIELNLTIPIHPDLDWANPGCQSKNPFGP